MNTNEIDKVYIGSNEVTKLYLGSSLVWEKDAPVGRIIPVGTGTGMLTIDGSNLTYQGSPTTAQPGDTIVIASGTYTATWPNGAINIVNFNLPSGFCEIKADGDLVLDGNIQFRGTNPNKGVSLDFRDIETSFTTYYPEKIIIDEGGVGGYERIKVRGFSYSWLSGDQYFIRHKGHMFPYSSGFAIKDLEISDIEISGSGFFIPIAIGDINDNIDVGYCEDVSVHDITCNGPAEIGTHVWIGNTEGFEVYNVSGTQVQLPETSFHGRFVFAYGRGDLHNIRVSESGGAAAVIQMFSRTAGQKCRIYNISSYNSKRYSTAEFRSHASSVVSGKTFVCDGEADFLSFWTSFDTGEFTSTCLDIYANVDTDIQIRNSVAVNPKAVMAVVNDNGTIPPTIDAGSCVAVANNTTTLLDTNMVPQSGSILIGDGVYVADIPTDINGVTRPNPPSIGACEPA